MQLTWHGHSTWRVDVDGTSLLVDPFFDNPHTSLDPSDVEDPDFVLLTHGHADHVAHVAEFPSSTVVGMPELTAYVAEEYGVEDTIGMNLGGTVECGDAYVTMHRSDHSSGVETGYDSYGGMPAGFVVSDTVPTQVADSESTTFYHAGDTQLMTDMREIIGAYLEPDAAAVPIGDHYTMGPWQAAIAVDWLNVDVAFPMHYDTFPPIEQDPEEFESEVAATGSDAEVVVLEGDETYDITETGY